MMVRLYLVALVLLATTTAQAQPAEPPPEAAPTQTEPEPEPKPEPASPPLASPTPPPPTITPEEQRALIEGRQQMLLDQRATSERQQHKNLVEGREQLLRDRRFTKQPEEEAARRATDEEARPRYSLALSIESLFRDDPGYDLFDDNDVSTCLGLWASYDLVQLAPRTVFAVEVGAGFESQEQDIWDGQLETTLDSQTFSAGVSLRYALLSWLDPQLRAAGGLSLFQFDLNTDNEANFEDQAVSGFGSLGAGVLLHTPERLFESKQGTFASFEFGFLIEGGYALRSPVEFELERESSALAIELTQASLGELALAGPYIRSSLVVRF